MTDLTEVLNALSSLIDSLNRAGQTVAVSSVAEKAVKIVEKIQID